MNALDRPLVTIAIPTYNRADTYLPQALESALSQTYPNIEIVVSDNCSTDNTEAAVRSHADPRIRYFRQAKNITPNDNFNFCLSQARGDYFLLLHDDDMTDPDFVDACMRKANYATNVGIIRTGTRIIDANGNVLAERENKDDKLSTEDFFVAWLESRSVSFLCSTLFNTKFLKEIDGFNSKHQLFQDVLAQFKLAAKFRRVDVQDVKASFRKHPLQRTSLTRINEWCEDSLFLLDNMCELTPEIRAMLIKQGMKKLAKHNYDIATKVRTPIKRYMAYFIVYQKFNYEYFPPLLGRFRQKISKIKQRISIDTP